MVTHIHKSTRVKILEKSAVQNPHWAHLCDMDLHDRAGLAALAELQ